MPRIIKEIEIEGKSAIALFDTGAYHTYIRNEFVTDIPQREVPEPYKVALGGNVIEVKRVCVINGRIEGYGFDTKSVPIEKIGKADGYELDAIIGALTMEEWEIKLDPKSKTLDLTGLKVREFTDYEEK
ncbi:MAG: hypothetical protein AB1567_02715 [bacterium]